MPMTQMPRWSDRRSLLAAGTGILLVTAALRGALQLTNATNAALMYLLVVLLTATVSSLRTAVAASIAADLCLNYFFMPPFGTFRIADPQNWIALSAFVAVSLVASTLSSAVRARALEADARRSELAQLLDFSRDVLLVTGSSGLEPLAEGAARRFGLELSAICVRQGDGWVACTGGPDRQRLEPNELSGMLGSLERASDPDGGAGVGTGRWCRLSSGRLVYVLPLRFGSSAVGFLAASGAGLEPNVMAALAGVVAIAIERMRLLEENKAAELARRSDELKSALLASLGHDLRTPLTAIRVAAGNLQSDVLPTEERREQSEIIVEEVSRLRRLFENILEMASIDAGVVAPELRWVHPLEVVEEARDQVAWALRCHTLDIRIDADIAVQIDPRLTAAALAHVLENAGQYAPPDTAILVKAGVASGELTIEVRDGGPGIAEGDLPHVFDRFYRGSASARAIGTGMGLAIARGLLAAQHGRISAANASGGGAEFTIKVPVRHRRLVALDPAI